MNNIFQFGSLALQANIMHHSQLNLNSDDDEQGEAMVVDSPPELTNSSSLPAVLPLGLAGGFASAQHPELPDENMDEAITASAENGATVSQGFTLRSSVSAKLCYDSESVRRRSSMSLQLILNIEPTGQEIADVTNVDMAGQTTTDSTDVEMVEPLEP
ncbi:hypothetical protein EMPS_07914 [Entomortierella parvispora]|uniref:Uncharacterized protein n=1 Tax=Entomortierella parvispora TaxID=205924 RepID=A0A9P3HFC9_9FUNG|nr:hypothetical protein EMPS_07914 [Entomortierella parvispora]